MLLLVFLINIVVSQNEPIDMFFKKFTKANYDNYNAYTNIFKEYNLISITNSSLAEFYYKNNNPTGYIVSFPNPDYFRIFIYIDPCRSTGEQFCCDGKGDCKEDHSVIISKKDLEIAWSANNYIPICQNDFDCGSYIEIHMPGNGSVIESYKISNYFVNGYQTVFLNTNKLCSGRYEIWFVIRMRDFNYINYVKPFYVRYPSCSCETIKNYNKNFNCI